ncbi:MAG: ABC transporter permease [archaeon GB-1867-005]|nr:ABC transporter permease [Candidatus Culexmicrobium cathedralense]
MSIVALVERDLNRFWKYKWWLAGIIAINLGDLLIMALVFGNLVRREYIPNYMQFAAPGIAIMALFISAFSIGRETAQEFRRGYNQYLLSLPFSDWQLAVGKMLAGTVRGLIYVTPFLMLVAILVGLPPQLDLISIILAVTLTSASMSSLGLALAPLVRKLSIYVTLRSLIYFIVFYFSTIFYPEEALKQLAQANSAYSMVYYIAKVNPASIAVEIIRTAFKVPQSAEPNIPAFIIGNLTLTILGAIVYVKALRRG